MKATRPFILQVYEKGGQQFASVEFLVDGDAFLAVVGKGASGGFVMEQLFRKNSERELDWYDNDLHQAYLEVSEELAARRDSGLSGLNKEELLRQLTDSEEFRLELEQKLG